MLEVPAGRRGRRPARSSSAVIDGLTIEHRAAARQGHPGRRAGRSSKQCHVILKGPTTTPRKGDPWPNVESANVAMRKELDLFANVRPVKVPEQGIDWTFYRENTEGGYAVGSPGRARSTTICRVDFTVTTTAGHASASPAWPLTTPARPARTGFPSSPRPISSRPPTASSLTPARRSAKEYPEIAIDDWYIDIMTAKLIDEKRRTRLQGVCPAQPVRRHHHRRGRRVPGRRRHRRQRQHRQALRHVRGHPRLCPAHGDRKAAQSYADPCSMLRAAVMLLDAHRRDQSWPNKLDRALDICMVEERKVVVTGRDTGATAQEFTDYVLETIAKL